MPEKQISLILIFQNKISKIINESGYEGYLSVEFEGWEDPLFACPRAIKNVKTLLRG